MATPRALVDTPHVAALLSLIAHADDPMLVVAGLPSAEGDAARVVAANVAFCRLSARPAAELIDQDWLTLIGTRADALQLDRIKRALARREHLALDVPLARADGLTIPTRLELLPVRDARGLATAFLIIQRDLAEQQQTRDALGSLRAMTRRASHDVNNGLASVIINLSLASSPRASIEELRERIRDALDAARDAAETSKRLTDVASNLDVDLPPASNIRTARQPQQQPPPPPQMQPQRPQAPPTAAEALATTGSLLILDDDETVKGLLATFLASCGYKVEAAGDSDGCVARYRAAIDAGQPFDLVILDLRIGRAGMGGLATLASLKAIDPHVKAIAHSGYSTDDVMLNPRKFGFVAAIKKPTAPSDIARLVEDLLHIHG